VPVVLFDIASKNAESGSTDQVCEPLETQNANIYSFCQPAGLLHDIVPAPPSKSSAVIGRSENDVAGVSGGRGSIVSYWASFGARLAGVAGVWGVGGGGWRTLLRDRRGHWQPKKRYEVVNEC